MYNGASLVVQFIKNPSAMQETGVPSLGWEHPREKEMTTHSSILAWEIPLTEKPVRLHTVRGAPRVRPNLVTKPPPKTVQYR